MKYNHIVLCKYSTPDILLKVSKKAETIDGKVIAVVKAGDLIDGACIFVEHRHMQGDVCDILYEACQLCEEDGLIVSSAKGFLENKSFGEFETDLGVECDELVKANLKFSDNQLVEVGEMPAGAAYRLYYKKAAEFIKAAKKVVLCGKTVEGRYFINTVINQNILDDLTISVREFP